MRQFGLIGFPLSHSFSPAFFAEKFAREKLPDCSYTAFPIESIDHLSDLIARTPNLEGLNVTIPYKKQVIPFLYQCTEAVQKMDACNCIKIKNGLLSGYNTDVIGFEKSLQGLLTPAHSKALILGTGGSAAAVEFVLKKLGVDYRFVTRNTNNTSSHLKYQEITKDILDEHKLIVNTTPLGMFPAVNQFSDIPYHHLTQSHYLYDLVYNPAETMFLKKGGEMGAIIKNGSDMLIIQAEESWKIWNEED